MKEKALTNLKVSDLWKEFKYNFYESFWDELEQQMKLMKKRFVEASLQEELTLYVGAKRYERSLERVNVRNGALVKKIVSTPQTYC